MRSQLPLASIAYLRLVEQGASRVGALKKAVDAVEPVVMLALARHMLGKWPTQAEYAEAAEISERTAQRQWAAFKNAFPTRSRQSTSPSSYTPSLAHDWTRSAPARSSQCQRRASYSPPDFRAGPLATPTGLRPAGDPSRSLAGPSASG